MDLKVCTINFDQHEFNLGRCVAAPSKAKYPTGTETCATLAIERNQCFVFCKNNLLSNHTYIQ